MNRIGNVVNRYTSLEIVKHLRNDFLSSHLPLTSFSHPSQQGWLHGQNPSRRACPSTGTRYINISGC